MATIAATLSATRLKSTVAIGTSPVVAASTTVTANLNADLLDGLHAAAFATVAHEHAAADVSSGTFADGRIGQANVTQHQAALAIAWTQITGEPTTLAGYGITDAAAVGHTHNIEALTTALGTDGQVWTKGAGGAMAWEDATGGGGGLADAFASVENSAGVEQFAASGATPLRFTAGADIGITFDAGDNEIIIAFTGSVSGITRGYADITGDSGASAAVGADTLIVAGAGGITTAVSSAPDTLTITLGNHSAALLTTGTVGTARLGTGTADATTFLRGDGTWAAAGVDETAAYAWTGNHSFTQDIVARDIRRATADGSDNSYVAISGGGAAVSSPRGAWVRVAGNEHASIPGFVEIGTGTSATAQIVMYTGTTTTERLRIDTAGVVAIGTSQVTSASAGDVVIANARALRAVNNAGTGTVPIIGLTGNALAITGPAAGTGLSLNGFYHDAGATTSITQRINVSVDGTSYYIALYAP